MREYHLYDRRIEGLKFFHHNHFLKPFCASLSLSISSLLSGLKDCLHFLLICEQTINDISLGNQKLNGKDLITTSGRRHAWTTHCPFALTHFNRTPLEASFYTLLPDVRFYKFARS